MIAVHRPLMFALGVAGSLAVAAPSRQPPLAEPARAAVRSYPSHGLPTPSPRVVSVVERGGNAVVRVNIDDGSVRSTYTLSLDLFDEQDRPIASASVTDVEGATATVSLPAVGDGAYSVIATLIGLDDKEGTTRWPWRRRGGRWSPISARDDFANVAFEESRGVVARGSAALRVAEQGEEHAND